MFRNNTLNVAKLCKNKVNLTKLRKNTPKFY